MTKESGANKWYYVRKTVVEHNSTGSTVITGSTNSSGEVHHDFINVRPGFVATSLGDSTVSDSPANNVTVLGMHRGAVVTMDLEGKVRLATPKPLEIKPL